MLIAYTMPNGRGDADLLLQTVAETLIGDGLQPCGAVQVNTNRTDGGPCDMDVQVLPDGPVIRISQTLTMNSDLGAGAGNIAEFEIRDFTDPHSGYDQQSRNETSNLMGRYWLLIGR